MSRHSVDEFRNWMGDALIRYVDNFGADEATLNGTVRIAAFDENWRIEQLYCGGICPIHDMLSKSRRVFAVDQSLNELHFAVRNIGEYRRNVAQIPFCFGANVRLALSVGDMYGLKPLLERTEETGAMTLTDVYCIVQVRVENAWRKIIKKEGENTVWTQENCLQRLNYINGVLEEQTKQIFKDCGMRANGDMKIMGVSMPLMVEEYR